MKKVEEVMRKEKLPDLIIQNFLRLLKQVETGETGNIPEKDITPLTKIERYENITSYEKKGVENIQKIAFIKLNGGLGTSMGLKKAKSLIEVKPKINFLDVIAEHIKVVEKKYKIKTPLVLMNSFSTEKDTKNHLEKHPSINIWSFKQFKHPRLHKDTLLPLNEENENLNWNPPGHGDIYPALVHTKILDELIEKKYEYAFISNSDNLGATLDPAILGLIVTKKIPFLVEVAERTPADKKGGHLAIRNNKLILRESAQCPKSDEKHFQDIDKHKFFNTNSLWINLLTLKEVLKKHNFILPLPLIRNEKNLDSKKIYQLETAMGTAIELFDNAEALLVPKSRFAPVKKTSDLLALWSDIYELNEEYQMVISKKRKLPPINIVLDDKYYSLFDKFKKRFEYVPSLIECESLEIIGDVNFGPNVKIIGKVKITNNNKQITIKNRTIKEKITF